MSESLNYTRKLLPFTCRYKEFFISLQKYFPRSTPLPLDVVDEAVILGEQCGRDSQTI